MNQSTGCCARTWQDVGLLDAGERAGWCTVERAFQRLAATLLGAPILQTPDHPGGGSGPPAQEDPDQPLIRAALSNDGNSFAGLVQRYEGAVTAILWRFTRDRLLLEELVQDTFVEAYFSLRRFRPGSPFFPWLRTIATRVGYRSWRRQGRDRNHQSLLADWQREVRPETTFEQPSDTAEYVYHMLELLDPKDRLVLTLQYFEGCSTNEIAERMGWSTSAVKVRAFRARKRLRALLQEVEQDRP